MCKSQIHIIFVHACNFYHCHFLLQVLHLSNGTGVGDTTDSQVETNLISLSVLFSPQNKPKTVLALLAVSDPVTNCGYALKPGRPVEGGKEGISHLLVENQGKKAGCRSCTRTSDGVGQDAGEPECLPGQVLLRNSMRKGLSTWSQGTAVRLAAERLQSRAGRCWAEKSPKVSVTGTQPRFYKKHISGDLSWEGWTCQFNAPSPQHLLSQGWQPYVCGEGLCCTTTPKWQSLESYIPDRKKLTQCVFLFSCHHLSVALLNTSTVYSRIFFQLSRRQMLHTHSRLLTDSILRKHTPFFRWVVPSVLFEFVLRPDVTEITQKGSCDSALENFRFFQS